MILSATKMENIEKKNVSWEEFVHQFQQHHCKNCSHYEKLSEQNGVRHIVSGPDSGYFYMWSVK